MGPPLPASLAQQRDPQAGSRVDAKSGTAREEQAQADRLPSLTRTGENVLGRQQPAFHSLCRRDLDEQTGSHHHEAFPSLYRSIGMLNGDHMVMAEHDRRPSPHIQPSLRERDGTSP